VERARRKVEEDVAYEMVSTLPDQLKAVLVALARLQKKGKGVASFGGGNVIPLGCYTVSTGRWRRSWA